MAEAHRSLELLLQCQVCFEEFQEDGDHVLRLLPCTHTLCHTCIGQLIRRTRIECPECRKKHEAKSEEKSFPQNKYLLNQIRKKSNELPSTPSQFETCEQHGEESNLFCTETKCRRAICRLCLRKQHKGHIAFPIEDHEKDILIQNLEKIKKNLATKVEMISAAQKNIEDSTKVVMEEIQKQKEEFNRHFEKMIKEIEEQNKLQSINMDKEISAMNSNIDLLKSLEQNIEKEEEISHEDIINNQETIRGIIENVNVNLSGERSFRFPVASLGQSSVGEILGGVTREEITISMPDLQRQIEEPTIPRAITNSSELKCTGKFYFVFRKHYQKSVSCRRSLIKFGLLYRGSESPHGDSHNGWGFLSFLLYTGQYLYWI